MGYSIEKAFDNYMSKGLGSLYKPANQSAGNSQQDSQGPMFEHQKQEPVDSFLPQNYGFWGNAVAEAPPPQAEAAETPASTPAPAAPDSPSDPVQNTHSKKIQDMDAANNGKIPDNYQLKAGDTIDHMARWIGARQGLKPSQVKQALMDQNGIKDEAAAKKLQVGKDINIKEALAKLNAKNSTSGAGNKQTQAPAEQAPDKNVNAAQTIPIEKPRNKTTSDTEAINGQTNPTMA